MRRSTICRKACFGLLCAALLAGGVTGQTHQEPAPPLALPNAVTPETADAVRLLEQATFGPTPQMINRVVSLGQKSYLDEELSARPSYFPSLPVFPDDSSVGCPTGSDPNCFRDNYTMYPLQVAFFLNASNGEDQLRQRVAFALSQILVTSGVRIIQPSSMSPYLNIFVRNAFGNFLQLLTEVTLSPTMGNYLDMANNSRTSPNENYAREILQLFSVGLWKLNADGTLQLDANSNPIPTYDQNTIINFAKVFTGWTYPPKPGATSVWPNPEYYQAPMVAFENRHSTVTKTLLNGAVSPANLTAKKDLVFALNNIFNHPNVGPFICKQLIQRLVTSNPSAGYIGRVVAAFNNNGAGVRGDLKAVVLAILLDSEARCPDPATCAANTDPNYGRLREPVLYVTNLLRTFPTTTDGVLASRTQTMNQDPFNSPTVFNYFRPGYIVPGTTVLGPEFDIENTSATIARANFVNTIVFSRIGTPPAGTAVSWTGMQALSQGDSTGNNLVNELDRLLLHGTMSTNMRTKLLQVITGLAGTTAADHLKRAQWAVYLVAPSSQYQVAR